MKFIQGLVVAFQFLTRLYLPVKVEWNRDSMKNSVLFFGTVGLFVGAVLYGIMKSVSIYINTDIAAFITLLVWIAFTGGLHIDGLSDMTDGFMSNSDREKTLKIMDDSHIGAFGVLSVVLIVLFKYLLIRNVAVDKYIYLIVPPIVARVCAGLVLANVRVAKQKGLAYMFHGTEPVVQSLIGFFASLFITALFNTYLIVIHLIGVTVTAIIVLRANKKLGGMTGDVYGAIVEFVEAFALLGVICLIK